MEPLTPKTTYPKEYSGNILNNEANASGVSWAAVIGGAFDCAALSLILLALGAGLGLSTVSPFSNVGASASTIGTAAILWLIVMQVLSSAMGGYLAGRLRTKWTNVHGDEVYFRDTAHGFLAWAVALVITAAFLSSAATAMVGSATVAGTRVNGAPNDYFVETLFRGDGSKDISSNPATLQEVAAIFGKGIERGQLSASDKNYLDRMVSAQTGIATSDAQQRVSEVFATAQQAADETRKALAHTLLWAFLALLIGAFCASLAATFGGRQRDHVAVV
jgi:hypothetical protein